jgi:hypothetical protein
MCVCACMLVLMHDVYVFVVKLFSTVWDLHILSMQYLLKKEDQNIFQGEYASYIAKRIIFIVPQKE